jgi:hypothetical protein
MMMSHKNYLDMPVLPRAGILWVTFMTLLWAVFGLGIVTHPEAWRNIQPVEPETGWNIFWFILGNNCIILGLIIAGNLFVRFGQITPGLIVLGIQAIMIGWTAGTNGFTEPFQSVTAANAAFLRIGLWETSSYVFICAVTLSKSLLISDNFPAKRWVKTTSLKDLSFSKGEILIGFSGFLALISSAYMEAFLPA